MDLNGCAALVTGGSGDLGRAIALALADAGADVAVTWVDYKDGAVETCRRVAERGRRTAPLIALTGFEERYLPVDLDRLCGTIQSVIAQRRKLTQITAANDKLRHGVRHIHGCPPGKRKGENAIPHLARPKRRRPSARLPARRLKCRSVCVRILGSTSGNPPQPPAGTMACSGFIR